VADDSNGLEIFRMDTATFTPKPTAAPTSSPTITPIATLIGYDANGIIEKNEVVQAVVDYFNGTITLQETINVVRAYFG
jgi:hypothetical protein